MGLAVKKKSPSPFGEGSVDVDKFLQELMHCPAQVASVRIHRRRQEKKAPLLHHDSVVVEASVTEFDPQEGPPVHTIYIVGEKFGPDAQGKHARIKLSSTLVTPESRGDNSEEKIGLTDLNVEIPMARLLKILAAHDVHYTVLKDNCWKYAHHTYVALLQVLADLSPENRNRIKSNLASPAIRRLVGPVDYIVGIAYIVGSTAMLAGMTTIQVIGITTMFGVQLTGIGLLGAIAIPAGWLLLNGGRLVYIAVKARAPNYGSNQTGFMVAAMQRNHNARIAHMGMHRRT